MSLRLHEVHPIVLWTLLVLMILPASANAAATKEKCKCDLETANDNRDGAEVSNAAKCFLVSDEERNWCTFDIEFMDSPQVFEEEVRFDTMLKTSVEEQDYDKLTRLVSDRFERWTTWGGGASVLYALGDISQNELGPTLSTILSESKDTLVRCMKDFVASSQRESGDDRNESGDLMQSGMLGCGIHQSGWLTLKLDVHGFSVYYLREPLHKYAR